MILNILNKLTPIIIGIILSIFLYMSTFQEIIICLGLVSVGIIVGFMIGGADGIFYSVIVGFATEIIRLTIDFVGLKSFTFTNQFPFFLSLLYNFTGLTPVTNLSTYLFYFMYWCVFLGIGGAVGGYLNKSPKY